MAIARVRAGDKEAYAELVRRHAPIALRTAVVLGAGSEADDVVQSAFVKAYRALGSFRDGAAFRPWLLRIVSNEARNACRAARRRPVPLDAASLPIASVDDPASSDVDPATVVQSAEERAVLLAALSSLREPYRLVVSCRYLLELDEAETATVLGLRRGTVKSRLHRALRQLRDRLGDSTSREEVADGG